MFSFYARHFCICHRSIEAKYPTGRELKFLIFEEINDGIYTTIEKDHENSEVIEITAVIFWVTEVEHKVVNLVA